MSKQSAEIDLGGGVMVAIDEGSQYVIIQVETACGNCNSMRVVKFEVRNTWKDAEGYFYIEPRHVIPCWNCNTQNNLLVKEENIETHTAYKMTNRELKDTWAARVR